MGDRCTQARPLQRAGLEPSYEAEFTFADGPFRLEAGGALSSVTLHYALYGEMNARRDNVLLVCHALSGSARVADWWPQLFGAGLPFDLTRFAVLGVNVLGSCYGSTGPTSLNATTGQPYGGDFPTVSILDMVRAQARLVDHLGIDRLHAVLGGSIGGMQALAWATEYPRQVPRCLAVGSAPLSAMGLALNHLQRQAIRNDPDWRGGHYPLDRPPRAGLALARGLAMCSYKSAELFDHRYGRNLDRNGAIDTFDMAGYLDYQGQIFNGRFDANSYLLISRAMDTYELGRTPEEEVRTLARIRARVSLIGIRSDWLFPPAHIRALAGRMLAAGIDVRYAELDSAHGHDGFLADADNLAPLLMPFLDEEPPNS
jgi:homoserine O-acetyltransferase/O-succinyltransferase